jgi:hypothetical protein
MRLSINQACERREKSNIARKESKGSMQCSKEKDSVHAMQDTQENRRVPGA